MILLLNVSCSYISSINREAHIDSLTGLDESVENKTLLWGLNDFNEYYWTEKLHYIEYWKIM